MAIAQESTYLESGHSSVHGAPRATSAQVTPSSATGVTHPLSAPIIPAYTGVTGGLWLPSAPTTPIYSGVNSGLPLPTPTPLPKLTYTTPSSDPLTFAPMSPYFSHNQPHLQPSIPGLPCTTSGFSRSMPSRISPSYSNSVMPLTFGIFNSTTSSSQLPSYPSSAPFSSYTPIMTTTQIPSQAQMGISTQMPTYPYTTFISHPYHTPAHFPTPPDGQPQ
ncbi:hypothetical protein A4A49_12756 [Nicotiana attenuata]|uniref:Uncharacterized protein n=1 Tax=Nicotiana attenuata TaxID=49451 RepID=A0A314KR55_NICAT|nr:hypothetical protein A4A49_12756 [Nicotiana attenuata]